MSPLIMLMSILHASLLGVPGVPQMINAREISRSVGTTCIIVVTWDPPTNIDPSEIDQYIVYVPSRNIGNNISSSTLTTLTVMNCGDDIRIQVAAVNRIGCVGMNSSEVLPVLLDIPTAPATSEGGSASTSSKHLIITVNNKFVKLRLAFIEIIMQLFDTIIIIILYLLILPPPLPFRNFLNESLEADGD